LFLFCKNVFVLGKFPVKVQPEILDVFLGELHVVYMAGGRGGSFHVVNVTWADLDPLVLFSVFYSG
jgi:hypothetical protein